MCIFLIFVILIFGLVVFIVWCVVCNEVQVCIDILFLGEIIEVEGYDVYVLVKGNGLDFVLIYGFLGNVCDFIYLLVDQLMDCYCVIVLDCSGLGYFDVVNFEGDMIFEQVVILQKVVVQLGVDKLIVVG